MKTRFDSPLNNARVASPCSVDWEQMIGDERTRFCGQCNLNVYNLSSMTRPEAEHLIASNEGRLCVRYYRRTDGSILTKDCPIGLRALKRKLSYVSKAIASATLTFLAGVGLYHTATNFLDEPSSTRRELMGVMAPKTDGPHASSPRVTLLSPNFPPLVPPAVTMGRVRVGQFVRVKTSSRTYRVKAH